MTVQATETDVQHSTTKMVAFSSSQLSSALASKGQYNAYQCMYNTPRRPSGFFMVLRSKVEMVFIYAWVLIQMLFLIAGLTVLHFSTFSVMVVYLVNGVIKRRRELLPQK